MKGAERPKLREDLVFRQVEEDFVAYDPVSDRTVLLNRSAAVLLDLCDGRRTLDEIAGTLAETYSSHADEIRRDLESSLEELRAQGLLAGGHAS